jgi:hypothetical protein
VCGGRTSPHKPWLVIYSKEELKVDLQGLERHFWLGTEPGRLGCYNLPGETWGGDGLVHKRAMGAGSVCLQQQSKSE